MSETKTEWTFWKENSLNQKYQLPLKEIVKKFLEWMKSKEKSWLEHYAFSGIQTIVVFVGDKETGLNSVAEQETYEELYEALEESKDKYLKTIGI